jgi:hypothetical protein
MQETQRIKASVTQYLSASRYKINSFCERENQKHCKLEASLAALAGSNG